MTTLRQLFLIQKRAGDRWLIGPFGLLILFVAAVLPPFLGSRSFFLVFLDGVLLYSMLTAGLYFIMGQGGIFSLAHAAFFGIGAYTSGLTTVKLGLPFPAGLVAAVAVAALGALIMSPILRLRHVYFAVASLAFGIIVYVLLNELKVTGGYSGLRGIPAPGLGALSLGDPLRFFYLALALLTIQYVAFRRLLKSPFGMALKGLRQNELASSAVGVNSAVIRTKALLIGCGSAGAAGSLLAHFNGSVHPQLFDWWTSVIILIMVVVGGLQSFAGAVLGAFLMRFITYYMRGLAEYKDLIYGTLIILFMIFSPRGLWQLIRSGWGFVEERLLERQEAV